MADVKRNAATNRVATPNSTNTSPNHKTNGPSTKDKDKDKDKETLDTLSNSIGAR